MTKLSVKNLDHLGIIAAIVDELGIVDYINGQLRIAKLSKMLDLPTPLTPIKTVGLWGLVSKSRTISSNPRKLFNSKRLTFITAKNLNLLL